MSSTKYHVNPVTGKVGVCRAQGKCKFETVSSSNLIVTMTQVFQQVPDGKSQEAAISELKQSKKKFAYELAISAVPRNRNQDWADYYAATDAKHFGDPTLPGSKFLSPNLNKFEDVIALAAYQRGNLDGDDRNTFISLGAASDAFKDDNRYLFVKTPGTVGILHSKELPDETKVQVIRTKPGVPCSLVYDVTEQPKADYAVIIMVTDEETGRAIAITGFPGVVTKSLHNEEIDSHEGEIITLGQVRKILNDEVWLNTRKV